MKLVSYDDNRFGAILGEEVVDLTDQFGDVLGYLRSGAQPRLDGPRRLPLASVALRAPVPRPPKILCMAGNYADHWREAGLSAPPRDNFAPQMFVKPVTTVVGPDEPIRLPGPICTHVDYEGELAAVIGRPGFRIPASRALDHVAAYANFNDVSGRKLTVETPRPDNPRTAFFDWLNGKWFDTFGPLGPWLVTADEVPDPQALAIQTRVNGEVRQKASTADMIFSLAETIEWISQFLTLEPGDLIATGTPSGVGSTTGTFLRPGDVVEVEVEGLGILRNPVVAAV
ncbi:MAG TPA: fumarylacetoacetate hydrolase family protein [Chloroflexota bacterium]|nr:fumarylacetoacetate hydrolase family protein [Chloroflexota bacterium]